MKSCKDEERGVWSSLNHCRINGKVATIAFNRPKALNALSTALLDEMSEALKAAEKDDHVNVIVLTGTGKKAFCAGADITEVKDLSSVEATNHS